MWTPSSWRTKPNLYHITYPSEQAAELVLEKIVKLPALVNKTEISDLKKSLKEVALGKAFVWQGGDCAELFEYCQDDLIQARIKLLVQLGLLFSHVTKVPVVLLARLAGQYGKPRNGLTEVIQGVEVPKFHGENINSYDVRNREPDPDRMLSAYLHSSSTLNAIRNGFTSEPEHDSHAFDWELESFDNKRMDEAYRRIVAEIGNGLPNIYNATKNTPFVFTSHEGLFLHYEQALTKPWNPARTSKLAEAFHGTFDQEEQSMRWFNSSAHFVWIGDKTRQLDGAHAEYFRGLENPIGIKVGPSIDAKEIVQLLDLANPKREIGKVTLITRLGEDAVTGLLGNLIKEVQGSGHTVVWQCDPLHGNTRNTSSGIRTRSFSAILKELLITMDIHEEHKSHLGGVHLEMTPDDVVECVGGNGGWTDGQLGAKYMTKCDPRLNAKQALEIAFMAAMHYQDLDMSKNYA